MSLRNSLRQSVTSFPEKCCTVAGYRGCNNATNQPETATAYATTHATTPMKSNNDGVIGATLHATTLQQALKNRATTVQQTATKEATKLQGLVRLCGEFYGFTEAEHAEALATALADFDSAMICFKTIARELSIPKAK